MPSVLPPVELGVDLPERWATHPVVVTESAVGDWEVSRAWWSDDAVLLRMRRKAGRHADDPGRDGLYGVGTVDGVARLVLDVAPELAGAHRSTVPRGTREALAVLAAERGVVVPETFQRPASAHWDWMSIDHEPERFAEEARVEELTGEAGLAEAVATLAIAHPDGELEVGDARSRWWGWRGEDGRLHSIVGAARRVPGAPWSLGSIGTDPAFRGRGLGAATTAAAVRAGLQESPIVALGMYAYNDVARRTYTRVGFELVQEFESAS